MIFETIRPCHELKGFVDRLWIATWDDSLEENQSTYFATVNTVTEIAFAFKGKQQGKDFLFSSVQGQSTDFGQYITSDFCNLLGVSLYSHSIPFLFDIPILDLSNKFTSLETLLGKEGKQLDEKMATASSKDDCLNIISDFLKMKLRKRQFDIKDMEKAAERIRHCQGNINIEKLAGDFCYSHKQFNRLFKEFVGFNPKSFARIVRFENILKYHKNYGSLTKLAHSYGYHDQSHFIREFKSFSGYSPGEFFKISGY